MEPHQPRPEAGHRHDHDHRHDHRHAPGDHDWGELGEHIEREGELLAPLLADALARLAAAVDGPVRRIVDAGSGPGVAAVALAEAFPEADVLALDASAGLLARAAARAARSGVAGRLRTEVADLEAGLPVAGPLDVVWASMVLHHVADPAAALAGAHAALRPGGLLAVVEFGPATRTLPDEVGFGRPGFVARYGEALLAAIADHLPPGALELDWAALLERAGFDVVAVELVRADLPAPLDADARRWVTDGLRRSAAMLGERLDPDDRATLAVLADPDDARGAAHRPDLEVHVTRTLHLARRR